MDHKHINIHEDLIDSCLAGDHWAQEKLYNLYSKAMFNICCRICNDRDDAEDVLQDAFISAFKNLHTYQRKAAFGAWLKRIVVNKALNFVKKNKVEIVPLEGEDRYEDDNTEEIIDFPVTVDQVKSAMNQLPDGYRIVFSLYLLEGYDHAEIADILNITTSTSKSQYNRSKKKIKEILQKEGDYEGQFGTAG